MAQTASMMPALRLRNCHIQTRPYSRSSPAKPVSTMAVGTGAVSDIFNEVRSEWLCEAHALTGVRDADSVADYSKPAIVHKAACLLGLNRHPLLRQGSLSVLPKTAGASPTKR